MRGTCQLIVLLVQILWEGLNTGRTGVRSWPVWVWRGKAVSSLCVCVPLVPTWRPSSHATLTIPIIYNTAPRHINLPRINDNSLTSAILSSHLQYHQETQDVSFTITIPPVYLQYLRHVHDASLTPTIHPP